MRCLIFGVLLLSFALARYDEETFLSWTQAHGKQYASKAEYAKRFEIFKANADRVARQNQNSKSAVFRLNKFADMSPEEFSASHGFNLPTSSKISAPQAFATACLANGVDSQLLSVTEADLQAVPTAWDWRATGGKNGKGIVTPVKDQGQCGSCWTFSTTGAIESAWAKKGNDMIELSEQLIVDCSHGCCKLGSQSVCNAGCNGGFQWNAFMDIINWGGLVTESAYPYTGETGVCQQPPKSQLVAPISNYTCLSGPNPADETALMAYIYKNGPVAIALDAGLLQFYYGGIIDPFFPNLECDPNSLDHALLIVGWGQERNWIGSMTPYWIVKNSWSASWGESGYFLIARNLNLCGIANAVSAPVM